MQDAPCREPADAANHQVGDGAGRQQEDEDLAVSTRYARPQSPTVVVKVSRTDVAGSAVMAARRPVNVAHLTSGPAGQRPPRHLHHSALVQPQDKTQGRKGNEAARVGNLWVADGRSHASFSACRAPSLPPPPQRLVAYPPIPWSCISDDFGPARRAPPPRRAYREGNAGQRRSACACLLPPRLPPPSCGPSRLVRLCVQHLGHRAAMCGAQASRGRTCTWLLPP